MHKKKKIYDSIQLISNDSIKRLAKVAGCPYLSTLACNEVKFITKEFLEKLSKIMSTLLESGRKKVVTQENILESLRITGFKLYPTGEEDKLKKCNVFHPTQVKHKRSRGELLEKELKFYQAQSDCVYLSKHGVETVLREIMWDLKFDIRFSAHALGIVQQALESHLIKLLKNAVLLTINCEKKTVGPKEIRLVKIIQESH